MTPTGFSIALLSGGLWLQGSLLPAAPAPGEPPAPAGRPVPANPSANLPAPDARLPVVAVALSGDDAGALRAVDKSLRLDAAAAHKAGFSYLRGRLLDRAGRLAEAADAYADAMGNEPLLRAFARFRMADAEARLGHPEVAAGLAATLLGSNPPATLIAPATELLRQSLAGGGDCRLLRGVDPRRLPAAERRKLQLVTADCHPRPLAGAVAAQTKGELLLDLLAENREDSAALAAAESIVALPAPPSAGRSERLLGLVFHSHREFARSTVYLERAIRTAAAERVSAVGQYELSYALARNHFWEGRYPQAASAFASTARLTAEPGRLAQALYQQGRAQELANDGAAASKSFLATYRADPRGENAAIALFALARTEFREGREQPALEAYQVLAANRAWRGTTARTAVFFAVSDLVRGRSERAAPWLAAAAVAGGSESEVAYWRGRLAELQGLHDTAVARYLEARRADPFHPLSVAARDRLTRPPLAGPARALGLRLSASRTRGDLWNAWLLLGDDHPRGGAARAAVLQVLRLDALAAPYLAVDLVAPQDWPLWSAALTQPEETLLALGLFDDGASAVARHFPANKPRLALTGATLLAAAGEARKSLHVAEIVAQRVPARVPAPFLPAHFRRLLYPMPWADEIARQAARRGVETSLIAAILREESRFDPRAVSAASARGLGQFVLPTARRMAPVIGLKSISPEDLERPQVSIALTAAYLAQLGRELQGSTTAIVAAYNAGEAQTALWQRYCFSGEPEELLSKVTFKETRAYVTRVLRSRAQYAELYPPPVAAPVKTGG